MTLIDTVHIISLSLRTNRRLHDAKLSHYWTNGTSDAPRRRRAHLLLHLCALWKRDWLFLWSSDTQYSACLNRVLGL